MPESEQIISSTSKVGKDWPFKPFILILLGCFSLIALHCFLYSGHNALSSHSMLVSLFFWSSQSLESRRIKCCSPLMRVFSMPAACVLSQKAGCGWLRLAGVVLQLLVSVCTVWLHRLGHWTPQASWIALSWSWAGCVDKHTHACKHFSFEGHSPSRAVLTVLQ